MYFGWGCSAAGVAAEAMRRAREMSPCMGRDRSGPQPGCWQGWKGIPQGHSSPPADALRECRLCSQKDAFASKAGSSSHLTREERGGGHSFLNTLENFILPSLPPGIPWPSLNLFLNQTIQRRCPGWGEALPSAVHHLFVQEKKHPSDGKVIPPVDHSLGTRTLSHQLPWELKDRNPLLDSVLFLIPKKRHKFGEKGKEIFHYHIYNHMHIKLEFHF